ncbi:MAG TPA: hypothetical protein VFH38_03150 [Jatrophihabitans sp.]|nr:hypothetical protein [Jatrophihabitans sp.]
MHLPGPVRAAVGLVASAADEARRLPDRALELPMLAVSTALQASLRAQQRYARLTARGDEVLNRTRPSDEPPEWAKFDEPVAIDDLGPSTEHPAETPPVGEQAPAKAPVRKAAAKKAPAKKAAAKKAPAAKAPAKKAPAPQAPADQATPAAANGKAINKPRHIAPSRFDDAPGD